VPTPTSYRLDPDLKGRLARRAAAEGISETALVTRLLEQGLAAIRHPGIVYRFFGRQRRALPSLRREASLAATTTR
jgi:hypothetical protein